MKSHKEFNLEEFKEIVALTIKRLELVDNTDLNDKEAVDKLIAQLDEEYQQRK